jgi:hypothetical protein
MTKHDIHGRHGNVGFVHVHPTELKPPSLWRQVAPYMIVAVLVGVPFCLGKYFEFNSPEPFDGGAYLYSAKHILDGARIGVDEIPSAHPGTLFVNMLSIKLFGYRDISPKIMQGLLQVAALIVMFLTLGKLWGKLAAGVSVVMASVYLSAPVIAKYGNVKEQFMIVFMVLGVCCFIWQQLNSRWWYALLAGAFLVWAPMFKPTGISAAAAVGFFVLVQPILKNRSWRQMGMDLALLLGGAVIAMAPMYIWILGWHVQMALPYWFLADFIAKHLPGAKPAGEVATDYVSASHAMMPYSELVPRVMRYYLAVILPVAMAIAAIVLRVTRWGLSKSKSTGVSTKGYERFVLAFGVWWILDMAFIWVSAHSYEQYYLPLTASAAMLGGYVVAVYGDRLKVAEVKVKWYVLGSLGLLLMLILAQPIFIGLKKSPYSGVVYTDARTGQPSRRNGYVQKWAEIQDRRRGNAKYEWEQLSYYIRDHSDPNDTIYVWGWYPGIYVLAERVSSTPIASEGSMHTLTPKELGTRVNEIVAAFEKHPPKFIVDSYKMHFPFNRPPLELWPSIQNGFRLLQYLNALPADQSKWEQLVLQTCGVQRDDLAKGGFIRADKLDAPGRYDAAYEKVLGMKWPDEAQRFEAMKPLRDYLMQHYRLVNVFDPHALFQRK